MQTLFVDIVNPGAARLLEDLTNMNLITRKEQFSQKDYEQLLNEQGLLA